jgi:predicted PurR-regulated permease PerM
MAIDEAGRPETPPAPCPLPPLARAFMASGLAVFAVGTLYFGAKLIVPVVEALLVCFILNATAGAIRRLPVFGRRLPWPLALLFAAIAAFALGFWVVQSVLREIVAMSPVVAGYQQSLGPMLDRLAGSVGLAGGDLPGRLAETFTVGQALRQIVAATAGTIGHFSIVAIYAGFLLVDQQFLDRKLRALLPDPAQRERTRGLLAKVSGSIQAYLLIMTAMSVLTAVLSYAVMRLAGLDYAFFWATAIFFLNYIPTIGSILGTALPATFALLQFQQFVPAAIVLAGIGAVQFVVGNILLPRVAGHVLNISLAVTIFSLFFWGALWGVTGLFVAMPLTAVLIIALGHFAPTRPLAILLSKAGDLDLPEDA